MAQVDTSIYGNMLRPVKSVQEYDAEAQQAEGNKLGLLLQRGQYDAQQRGVAEDASFRNLLSSGADEKALMAASPTKALALMKGRAEIGKETAQTGLYGAQTKKAEADTGKTNWEAREAKRKTALTDIAALDSPETAIRSLQAHFQAGDLDEQKYQSVLATIPQNPADFPAWQVKMLRSIMSAENQMLDERKRTDQTETARNNKAQNGIAAGQLGVAQGQLGVARQRLAQDHDAPKGQYDPERGVLIDPRTGEAKPVTMGGKPLAQGGAKMTEDQSKATGWLVQAENAWKNMQAAIDPKTGSPSAARPGFPDAVGEIPSFGFSGAVANMMRGKDRQKFLQGVGSLSEALLRAATGAGVNKEEAEQKVRELTPVFGEDQETTAQKMAAIPLYIESLKVRAGPGAAKAAGVLGGKTGGGWSITPVGE